MRLAQFLALLTFTACAGNSPMAGDGPDPDGSTAVADARLPDAGACVPLASVVGVECPPTWTAALADKAAFCAKPAVPGLFDAFTSSAACGGFLRYSRYLFDGGPRFCIYDPTSQALKGYRASDPKALRWDLTCGNDLSQFDEAGCTGTSCAQTVP
jgi:hypothetical protein